MKSHSAMKEIDYKKEVLKYYPDAKCRSFVDDVVDEMEVIAYCIELHQGLVLDSISHTEEKAWYLSYTDFIAPLKQTCILKEELKEIKKLYDEIIKNLEAKIDVLKLGN